jgi:hypothetical protein
MKGMQKIRRGRSFRGVANYTTSKGHVIGGNMISRDAKELSAEFAMSRQLRPNIEKPVWHNSLRLPVDETISEERWVQIADEYMQKMGFTDLHQRFYTLENDKNGQHIHIVASRIGLDGSLYYGRNENLASTRIIQELEKKHELTITKGPEVTNDKKTLTKNEIDLSYRTKEAPTRQKLQRIIDDVKANKPSAPEFMQRLIVAGVGVKANVAKNGRMNGFSFELDGISFKSSQLGRSYSWSQLQQEVQYEQARDSEKLRQLNTAVASNTTVTRNRAESERAADARSEQFEQTVARNLENTAEQHLRIDEYSETRPGLGAEQRSASDAKELEPAPAAAEAARVDAGQERDASQAPGRAQASESGADRERGERASSRSTASDSCRADLGDDQLSAERRGDCYISSAHVDPWPIYRHFGYELRYDNTGGLIASMHNVDRFKAEHEQQNGEWIHRLADDSELELSNVDLVRFLSNDHEMTDVEAIWRVYGSPSFDLERERVQRSEYQPQPPPAAAEPQPEQEQRQKRDLFARQREHKEPSERRDLYPQREREQRQKRDLYARHERREQEREHDHDRDHDYDRGPGM